MTPKRRFTLTALACVALGAIITTAVAWGSVYFAAPRELDSTPSSTRAQSPPVEIPQWMVTDPSHARNAWGVQFDSWHAWERRESDPSGPPYKLDLSRKPSQEPPRSSLNIERLTCGWPLSAFEAVSVRPKPRGADSKPLPAAHSALVLKFSRAKDAGDLDIHQFTTIRFSVSESAEPETFCLLWIPTAIPLQPIPTGFVLNTFAFALIAFMAASLLHCVGRFWLRLRTPAA